MATRGDIRWPPPGTLTRPWTRLVGTQESGNRGSTAVIRIALFVDGVREPRGRQAHRAARLPLRLGWRRRFGCRGDAFRCGEGAARLGYCKCLGDQQVCNHAGGGHGGPWQDRRRCRASTSPHHRRGDDGPRCTSRSCCAEVGRPARCAVDARRRCRRCLGPLLEHRQRQSTREPSALVSSVAWPLLRRL